MSLRDAAQQALKAMRLAAYNRDVILLSDPPQDAWKARNVAGELSAAITALEAALAEPQPEPVHHKHEWFRTGEMKVGQCRCIHCGTWGHEVFSPAPQRQPLSDTNILEGWRSATAVNLPFSQVALSFARWLEAMHGIGGGK